MTQLVWPNGLTTEPTRSDSYGPRAKVPGLNTRPFHVGQDWHSIGNLKSIGAGTVVENGWGGWAGWTIVIYLGEIDGVRTWVRYCHLASQSPLPRGAQVSIGQHVGWEGNTGDSVGSHLHLEIYRGRIDRGSWADTGATVDPRAFISKYLTKKKGDKVIHYTRQDHAARNGGRTLNPGEHFYLNINKGAANSSASNIVGGVGQYSITPHVYAKGKAGDALDLVLIWSNDPSGKRPTSNHYEERLVLDKTGNLKATREFKRRVDLGFSVYARVTAVKTNEDSVKVTLFDSDSYLFQ